jgi:hypothetical protein
MALRVFLSHKEIDRLTAQKIATALRRIGGPGVDVSISGEHPGTDYRNWIEAKLEQAEWYVLAYTEPAKNWDWCLYEAGYFEAAKKRDQGPYRIICLHPGEMRPKPLDKFDSVIVNKPDEPQKLEKFCEDFLTYTNPTLPLNDKIAARDDLKNLVNGAFKNVMHTLYRGRHITISVPPTDSLRPNDLPDGSRVFGTTEIMAEIFGINSRSTTWSRVKTIAAATQDPRWIVQLAHGIANIRNDQFPPPITGQIQTQRELFHLLPVLNRVDELEDQTLNCEILLAEGITSAWAKLNDENIRALVTSLRMTVRFRYDVIDVFAGRPGTLRFITNRSPRKFREVFRTLMFDISSEARASGLSGRHILVDCFDDPQERAEVAKLYQEWEEQTFPQLVSAIGMSSDPEVWTTFDDTPFGDDEIAALEGRFNQMREMNTRYLELALNRYRELITAGRA